MSIKIDYSKDEIIDEFAMATLKDRYMIPGEESPQEAFARAAEAFADDEAHAQRLYDYVSQMWFMFATPVLSNGGTKRGLPISCFLNYVDDSREGITDHFTENAFLSSFGGGIGGTWSDVRSSGTKTSKGSESTGVVPFMKVVDAEMLAFSQGVTRRGSYASYLHITHPEIEAVILIVSVLISIMVLSLVIPFLSIFTWQEKLIITMIAGTLWTLTHLEWLKEFLPERYG